MMNEKKTHSALQDGYYLVARIENGKIKPLQQSIKSDGKSRAANAEGKMWSRKSIPVMCQGTKKVYPSIRQAAIAAHAAPDTIVRAISDNKEINGFRFTYAN